MVGCDDAVLMGHGPHTHKEDAQMPDAGSKKVTRNKDVPPKTGPIPPPTAIAVILDETGSMESCRDAAIEGFNAWLAEQQRLPAQERPATGGASWGAAPRTAPASATLTLIKFSERPDLPMCRLVCDGEPLAAVRPLDRKTYTPDGGTPLLDAVGRTIMWMDRLKPQPDRILVVILTDGEENASREFTRQQIQDLIRSREATGTWTFVYLGANQDAWAAGEALGIAPGNRAGFDVRETRHAFERLSATMSRYRVAENAQSVYFWGGEPPAGETASSEPPADQPPARPNR
jgi:hypothetical protein